MHAAALHRQSLFLCYAEAFVVVICQLVVLLRIVRAPVTRIITALTALMSARACNPDAQFVLDDLELRNQSLQAAADAIVANMQADGYVSADANSILVTVEAGKGDARLRDRLAAAVENAQTDCDMEPAVLAQVLEDDPGLEAYASAMGVSAGKAMLIRQISAQVQELTGSELVGLPINDLNILAASNKVDAFVNGTGCCTFIL